MQVPALQERPWTAIASDAVLIAGGTFMVIGSFSPWTHGTLLYQSSAPYTVYRNGMQLGSYTHGFSIAGLITVIFGAVAILSGSLVLAGRRPPRVLVSLPLLYGVVGVAVGLYADGEATWYSHQLTEGYPTLYSAGASYGIWLLLGGATAILLAGLLAMPFGSARQRVLAAVTALVAVSFTTAILAPH